MAVWIVKVVFHYIAFPTLCAVVGMALEETGVLGTALSPLAMIPGVGGFAAVMGGAFATALIAVVGERLIFFPLFRAFRGKEYKDGEYGAPR
jgi:hypothetical protein